MTQNLIHKPFIIYSTATCPGCQQAIEWLNAQGIECEVRDLYTFPNALEDVLSNVGLSFHLPIFRVGMRFVIGHNPEKLVKLVRSAGYNLGEPQ